MLIKLRVHPGSKKNAVERKAEDRFEVWVKAPAERGRANEAALSLVGEALSVPATRIRLVKGAQSPSKIIEVPL
jgi:uncharacterized protein (TIGR00251 family)